MRIDADDFRRLQRADAVIPAQAQHVLGVAHALTVTRNRLNGKERESSYPAQPSTISMVGDIKITLRTAVMDFAKMDGTLR